MTKRQRQIATIVTLAKKQIREDVAAGHVPRTVASFAALHDHVDANEYGADAVPWRPISGVCDVLNPAQAALDGWIRRGGLRR